MKHLSIVYFALFLFATGLQAHAQKKWVVEYNKLADTFSYYEVLIEKGKETEKPLSKAPAVFNGDVIKFRCINLNDFVFSVRMDDVEGDVIGEESSLGLASTLVSMMSPIGFAGNFGKTMDFMDQIPSIGVVNLASRGSAEASAIQMNVASVKEELSELVEFAAAVEAPTAILYAEDLTLEEIRDRFSQASSLVDRSLFDRRKSDFEEHLNDVIALKDSSNVKEEKLDEAIDELSSTYDKFKDAYITNKYSPIDHNRIKKELESRTFSVEKSIVVNNSQLGSGASSIFWNLEFSADRRPRLPTMENESDLQSAGSGVDGYFTRENENTLRSNVIVQLPIRGAVTPKLSSGLLAVLPFSGFSSFSITPIANDFGSNDSIVITESIKKSPEMAIGTMVNFTVSTKGNIIPSFGFGASYSLTKGSENALGLLVGGHLGLKSFPFLHLSYGLNFRQAKVLKAAYNLNEPIAEPVGYGSENELFEYVFKPALYLGLSMQF